MVVNYIINNREKQSCKKRDFVFDRFLKCLKMRLFINSSVSQQKAIAEIKDLIRTTVVEAHEHRVWAHVGSPIMIVRTC